LVNGEKLLALLEADVVHVVALGRDYRIEHGENRQTVIFKAAEGKLIQEEYDYFVDATGQSRNLSTNDSALMRNLMATGNLLFEKSEIDEPRVADKKCVGSLLVDPQSHRVLRHGDLGPRPSNCLFAVGAMTRSQMIDVSMAAGLVRSTDEVAELLVSELTAEARA
jgi:hypothetical protein